MGTRSCLDEIVGELVCSHAPGCTGTTLRAGHAAPIPDRRFDSTYLRVCGRISGPSAYPRVQRATSM
jgi:hypothetical protein